MSKEAVMLCIVILYFVVVIGIGIYARKSASKSVDDYVLGGRRMPPAVLALTMMAYMWAGGPSTVGGLGYVWSSGLEVQLWVGAGAAFGFAFAGIFFSPFLRRMSFQTMPDILAPQPTNVGSRLVSGLVLVFRQAISVGVDLIAIGVLATAILPGVGYRQVILVATIITVIYTLLGGLWAIALTDTIQILLVFAGTCFLLPIIMIVKAGGLAEISQFVLSEPSVIFGSGKVAMSAVACFSSFFMTGVFTYVDQGMYQRFYSAKQPRDAITASIAMGVQWAIWPAILSIIAMAGRVPGVLPAEALAMVAENTDSYLPALIIHCLPPVVGGILLAVVLAAMMSSCDALFLSIGTNFAIDIWKKIICRGKEVSDKAVLRATRVGVCIAGVIGMLIALPYGFADVIMETQFYAYRLSIAFLTPILGRLFWKKITQSGMICGMLATVAVIFCWNLGLNTLTGIADATVGALIVNVVVTVVVSLLTYKPTLNGGSGANKTTKVTLTSIMTSLIMLVETMHPAPLLRSQVAEGMQQAAQEGGSIG